MLVAHRAIGTFKRMVDAYVALNRVAREAFIQCGLPADRIWTKANFLDADPGPGAGDGGYILFVGRLSSEKGVAQLLQAWRAMDGRRRLKVVGDGPLRGMVEEAARSIRSIEYEGPRAQEDVLRMIGAAQVLVVPSQWYEGMPRTIIEAFACGTPVMASCLGSMEEMVVPGKTGWLVEHDDPRAWAGALDSALSDATRLTNMRGLARAEFEARYCAKQNYPQIMGIYAGAMRRRGRVVGSDAQME